MSLFSGVSRRRHAHTNRFDITNVQSGNQSEKRPSVSPFLSLALVLFAACNAAVAAPLKAPLAGSQIENRAQVTFDLDQQSVRLDSNTVRVSVLPQEALTLTANNTQGAPPNATVSLPHRLTNTGNVAASYTLNTANLSGDDFDLSNLALYRDVNGNGQIDLGETQLANGDTITLDPGTFADLVVTGTTPANAAPSQSAQVQITANSTTQNQSAANTDTVSIASGIALRVFKSAIPQQAARGEVVTFAITATSYGSAAPQPITVQVDGAPRNLVILRDVIPANTTFVSLSDPGNGIRLYHRVGEPRDTYTTAAPPLSEVDAVAYGLNSFNSPSQTVQVQLRVRIGNTAAGNISNTANFEYSNGVSPTSAPSNEVLVVTPASGPVLRYYTNNQFVRIASASGAGNPLYLQAEASANNLDPTKVETIVITIRSALTGDFITIVATETGPNTGIFRTNAIPTNRDSANNADGILQTQVDDTLTARIVDVNGGEATANIAVDPFGVVFDSRTNAPVAGATVTLIDVNGTSNGGNAGGPATVFQFDGVTPAPSTVVTGADGAYQFPLVSLGTYRLQITPPAGYTFPSVVPVDLLPPSRVVDPSGSYGGNFVLSSGDAQQFDVPVDGPVPSGLFIEKTALRSTAEIGEFVDYRVEIRNNSGSFLSLVRLLDVLPRGFIYQTGSTRINGVASPDPAGAPGPNLTFTLSNLGADQQVVVTYRVKIGATVKLGRNANRALWRGVTSVGTSVSNVASAVVDVRAGVFTTRGIIYGKVFVDNNKNRVQDKGELGIPNVRVYLEDGTFSITDVEGEYSIYGVSASTHNVKLDKTTMPAGSQLQIVSNRNLGDAGSVLADLKNGEMHKVNFAENSASESVLKEVAARRKAAEAFLSESEDRVRDTLTTAVPTSSPSNSRALPASGILSGSTISDNYAGGLGGTRSPGATGTSNMARGATSPLANTNTNTFNVPSRSAISAPLDGQAAPPQSVYPTSSEEEFKKLLPNLTKELSFIDLKDQDTLPSNQINVRVKGAFGGAFRLTVNGDEMPESRVGTRSALESNGIMAWEYVGVRFKSGSNTLVLTQIDDFGNVRGSQTITVIAPGQLGRLLASTRNVSNAADGRSLVPVTITLTDDKGIKVTARTPVTLEAERGQWQTVDLNPNEFGVQVFVEGGEATFNLLSPLDPGQVQIRATSGLLESNLRLTFVPELRPLIASGLGDLKLNLSGFRARGAQEIATSSLFDDELKGIQSGKGRVNGRGALFLKGRVQGKYLLTLRYDTEKQSGERLFRDIQPDEFYPVYGDSSIKGFDAQSTSRLYVRVDRNQSYALYGDFTTSTLNQLESLGRNSRSLNGVQLHRETSRFAATVYGSRDSTRQIVQEVRGRGLSGPYALENSDYRENSEKVEIIVRDRNQPNVILSTTPQTRFSDYEIDRLTDGLLFRRPVPALDADLNPVFIRITYEVETGGPRFNLFGANGQFKLSEKLQIGASYAHDDDPLDTSTLISFNAVARLAPNTIMIAEVARSNRDGSRDGDLNGLGKRNGTGSRLELIHNDDKLQARIFAGQTSRGFDNPESVLNKGRSEISARATLKLNEKTRLAAEAIRTTDRENGQKLSGAQVSVEKAVSSTLRGQFGIRYSSGDTGAGSGTLRGRESFTSLFGRATKQVNKKANLFARYERQLTGDKQSLAVGGDYQIADRTRLYLTHEFLDSLDGLYALNEDDRQYNTRFGIESDYMRNGSAYSEYRIGSGIDGRSAQAAIGLRNLWTVRSGLRVNTNLERIRSTGEASSSSLISNDDSISAGVGVEYLSNEKLKATARIEKRSGRETDGFLQTFGVAYKPSDDLTVLARNIYSTTSGEEIDRAQDRLQIGLAFRQAEIDKLSALLKYEYRYDKNSLEFGANTKRGVHILSGDLNYQPRPTIDMTLHYAWKNAKENSLGLSSKASAQLLSGRVTKELSRKFDVSIIGSRLWDGDGGNRYGLGAELGYILKRNLLFSVGYNFAGFRDRDLIDETLSRRGLYVRLRFKFDESMFRRLEGERTSIVDDSPGFTPLTISDNGPILSSNNSLFGAAPGQLSQN